MRGEYHKFTVLCNILFKHPNTLKKLIDSFIMQNEVILEFLETTGRDYEQADHVLPKFADLLNRTNFNAALGTDFANILQLSDDKKNFEQFELSDISRLFASLLKVQEFNLDTYVEAAHFESAIMDNKEKATSIAKNGIQKAKNKIDELQRLLETIHNDRAKNGA
jgi:hypothetical protein